MRANKTDVKRFPPKYELVRNELRLAAYRGGTVFRQAVNTLWGRARGPFQVLNSTGDERPANTDPPEGCLFGDPVQVRLSAKYPMALHIPAVACTDQLTTRVGNDPDVPAGLDEITPDNWERFFDRMCEYQVELDETVRRRNVLQHG